MLGGQCIGAVHSGEGDLGMGQPSSIDDPKHWLDRAEEARAVAELMIGDEAKRIMLGIAAGYARLAWRAQERLKTDHGLTPE